MNWMQKAALALFLCAVGLVAVAPGASADNIRVIGGGHGMITNAINHLNNLGHTVTNGGTLADYSAYDQVWDLRYNDNLGAGDVTAMGSFLAGGGRLYMTGEHSGFNSSRNNSLISFVNAVGGGALSFSGNGANSQQVTAAGQVVNSPNVFGSVGYGTPGSSSTAGSGFLVTSSDNGQTGSLVGWDFGDIAGAANARMLVGFDIEIFSNPQTWTDNMATYLSVGNQAVPEPGSWALMALGAAGLIVVRRRKRASA